MDWRAPRYVAVATHIPGFLTASCNSSVGGRCFILLRECKGFLGGRHRLDLVQRGLQQFDHLVRLLLRRHTSTRGEASSSWPA